MKCRGLRVSIQKFDPYINVDPGTMSPYQHGEVFVMDDGAETDLDLGHYERFIDESLTQAANVTSGRVYKTVIDRERQGGYLGATIQVIPHITDEIKRNILLVSKQENAPDVVITEIGGTVGDIESQPFLEAIRQMRAEVGFENSLYIHVTLIPFLKAVPTRAIVVSRMGFSWRSTMVSHSVKSQLKPVSPSSWQTFSSSPSLCSISSLNRWSGHSGSGTRGPPASCRTGQSSHALQRALRVHSGKQECPG